MRICTIAIIPGSILMTVHVLAVNMLYAKIQISYPILAM